MVTAPSLFLCAVHRHISISDEGVSIRAVIWKYADSDAGSNVQFMLGNDKGQGKSIYDLLGNTHCLLHRIEIRQKDYKLITSPAGNLVLIAPTALFEPVRHSLKKLVTDGVSEGIVYDLKPVKVKEKHRQKSLVTLCLCQ
jgi:hypothetical protein